MKRRLIVTIEWDEFSTEEFRETVSYIVQSIEEMDRTMTPTVTVEEVEE